MDEFRPNFWLRSYRGDEGRHNHPFHQFLIGLDGHLKLYTDAGDFTLTNDTGVLVSQGRTHEYYVAGRASLLVVDIAHGTWDDLEGAVGQTMGVRSIPVSRQLACLLRDPKAKAGQTEKRWQPSEQYIHDFRSAITAVVRPSNDDRVSAAVSLLEARHEASPRIAEVAAAAQLSPAQLNRLCNKHLGSSPARLARSRRLEHAAQLLVWTDSRIANIAAACGYADQATFTRAFSRKFGLSPGRFRTRHDRCAMRESAKTY